MCSTEFRTPQRMDADVHHLQALINSIFFFFVLFVWGTSLLLNMERIVFLSTVPSENICNGIYFDDELSFDLIKPWQTLWYCDSQS